MPATSDELAGIDLIGDEGTYSAIDVLTTHGHSGCRPQTFAHNSPTKVVRRGAFSGWIGVQPDTAVVTPARQERKAMISEVEKRRPELTRLLGMMRILPPAITICKVCVM